MKDKASSVKVGVADNNVTRGGHILHEQEYNTGHGIPAIPDEVRRKMWRWQWVYDSSTLTFRPTGVML